MLGLFARVLGVRLAGGLGQGHYGVPVLAGVVRKVLTLQLAAVPPAVEGMVQQVPALTGFVESGDQFHGSAPFER